MWKQILSYRGNFIRPWEIWPELYVEDVEEAG